MTHSNRQDWEPWQRTIFETLRPIDPDALFWVSVLEIDFRDAPGRDLGDFPAEELRDWVDAWLSELNPDAEEAERDWTGGGVRVRFQTKGRTSPSRGWTAMPSFALLEQQMSDLHLVPDDRREFISLTLDEVQRLANGELRVVGQGASYQETFRTLAEEMEGFGLRRVADMHPTVITVYAGQLGLLEPPPSLGNFEHGWRDIHRRPPDD